MAQFTDFKNLKELMTYFSDEGVCRAYMEKMRWEGNPVCPHCGAEKPYKLKDGKTWRCSSRTCRKDFSVLVGTIFENSKVKLSTWLAALYLLTGHKKGISSLQLGRDLGVTQKTAWFILHRIRLIMGDSEQEKLDNIVEVDETYVGGKWDNMHSKKRKKLRDNDADNKVPVMGLVERNGRAKLTLIGEKSFKDVVLENVNKESVVITDSHLSYQGLNEEYAAHGYVNHSQGEYVRDVFHINSIESIFSMLKRSIFGIYHQVSPKHLHRYCAETAYRYNTRKMKDDERLRFTLSNTRGRLKYKDLIQKN